MKPINLDMEINKRDNDQDSEEYKKNATIAGSCMIALL